MTGASNGVGEGDHGGTAQVEKLKVERPG